MFRAKRFYSLDFIFVIITTVLVGLALVFFSNDTGPREQRKLIEKAVNNNFEAALAQVKSNAILLFELQYNNAQIIPLLEQAKQKIAVPAALQVVKAKLENNLSSNLQFTYETFSYQQIYLTNGQALLNQQQEQSVSVESTNDNIGLKKVLNDQTPSFGLSLINGVYMYRYFFPTFDAKNEFLAVVEVATQMTKVQQILAETHKLKSQYLLAKRPLAAIPHKHKIYQSSLISNSFLSNVNGDYQVQKRRLNDSELNALKRKLGSDQESKLMQLKPFSINFKMHEKDHVAVFIPISDINKYQIGAIIITSPTVILYASFVERNTIICILLFVLAFVILYTINKSFALQQFQTWHQDYLEALPFPIFLKNGKNQYSAANQGFFNFLGITQQQLLDNKNLSEPDEFNVSIAEVIEAGGELTIEFNKSADQNNSTMYSVSYFVTGQENALNRGVVGFIKNISEDKFLQESLDKSKSDHLQFMDILPLGVRIFDLEGNITYVNHEFENISGYIADDLLNADCEDMFNCLQCNTSICPVYKSANLKHIRRIESIKYDATGDPRTCEMTYYPYYNINKEVQGVVEFTRDITINKLLLDKNNELLLTDELTGLFNNRGLISAGENYFRLAERADKAFFVLYVDIINLRKINVEYGDAEGDKLISALSDILKMTFRETDIVARIGSDEFVILMNDSGYQVVNNDKFSRLDDNIYQFNLNSGKEYRLMIDCGIVEYDKGKHENLSDLVKDAEQLVYERRLKRTLK